jgi:hypothetical protein
MCHIVRHHQGRFLLLWCLFFAPVLSGSVLAEKAGDAHPALTRLSPTEAIWFDPLQKELVVGGKIVLTAGPLELLACPVGSKEHESIIAVQASPRLIYTGLLAIGLQPTETAGPPETPPAIPASQVCIRIRWEHADGNARQSDAREWVRSIQTGKSLSAHWVFRGGGFFKTSPNGSLTAIDDGSDLICVANFPRAMLDLPLSSPTDNGLLLYEAFTERIPPIGTPVEIVLSACSMR